MSSYPHIGTSLADRFLQETRLAEQRADHDADSENSGLLSHRRFSAASRPSSVRNPLLSPFTPVDDNASAISSDASSVDGDLDAALTEEELKARIEARSSFSRAFRNVYGTGRVEGDRAKPQGEAQSEPPGLDTPKPTLPVAQEPLELKESVWWSELRILVAYTLPVFGTQLAQYSLTCVSVVIVGHLGVIELAASSLGSMTCNVVAFSVIQGFASALESLCPAAYASPKPWLCSTYALRTFVLVVLLMIPQTIIFWNSEAIFLTLSFSLPAYGMYECSKKWLQGQGRFSVPAGVLAIVAPINLLLTYLLVLGPIDCIRFGFIGAPISSVISFYLMAALSIVYSVFFLPKDAWGGFDRRVFHELGLNAKLGFAGTLMIGSEWWCWEVVGISTSYISPAALAAQSVLGVVCSLTYQVPYSISSACAVRVSSLIGAGQANKATSAARVGAGLAVVVGTTAGVFLAVFRDFVGRLFTSDAQVIKLVASVLPIIALFQVADSTTGVASGLLRGAGRPHIGAIVNLTAYYIIGLPVGFALTFSDLNWGLIGLWTGLTVALGFTSVVMTFYVLRIDWHREVLKAQARFGAEGQTHTNYGTLH